MAGLKTPPALFAQGLRMGFPNIADENINELYNKAITEIPGLENIDPLQLGKTTAETVKAQIAGKAPALPGPTPEINTNVKSPFAGTTMAERNPQNPQAELMNQFDPEMVGKARAEYERLYNETAARRGTSQYLAAAGGGTDALKSSRESWEDLDKLNEARTFGDLTKRQTSATSGITGAQNLATMFKTQGEDALARAKGVQELIQASQKTEAGGHELHVKRLLNTPGNGIAAEAIRMAIEDYKVTHGGNEPDQVTKERWSKMSAAEVATFSPSFMSRYKAYLDAAKVGAEVAGAAQGQATVAARGGAPVQGAPSMPVVTPLAVPRPPIATIPPVGGAVPVGQIANPQVAQAAATALQNPKVQQAVNATNASVAVPTEFPIIKSALTPSKTLPPPTGKWNETLYGTKPSPEQMYSSSVSAGPMGATVSEDSFTGAKKSQTAAELDYTQKFVTGYDSSTRGNVIFALNNATPQYSERVAQLKSKIINDPIGQKMANATASLNEAGRAVGIVAGAPSNIAADVVSGAGRVASSIPNPYAMAAGGGLNMIAPTLEQKAAVTAESPHEVIRDLAVRVAVAEAQQRALLPYKRDYSVQNNRNLEGFTETPVYKQITDTTKMVPLIDLRNGRTELVDRTDKDKLRAMLSAGYQPAMQYLIKGEGPPNTPNTPPVRK